MSLMTLALFVHFVHHPPIYPSTHPHLPTHLPCVSTHPTYLSIWPHIAHSHLAI